MDLGERRTRAGRLADKLLPTREIAMHFFVKSWNFIDNVKCLKQQNNTKYVKLSDR